MNTEKLKANLDFKIENDQTQLNENLYKSKDEYEKLIRENQLELDKLQSMMYAHGRYGLLVIFQAMDAAGKDGTIKAVFQGVNPQGLGFYSFKRPSEEELSHDFLWRCFKQLPERGKVQVFNRSYYEEVLVVKVHPEILTEVQQLPKEKTENLEQVWQDRYEDIKNFENYLYNNGIEVVKIFLHVSKEEQAKRLIERIEDVSKNWKFQEGDIKERALWKEYMQAYEEMIKATHTEINPWYIVPADDKKDMRLMTAQIILDKLKTFKMNYPEPDEARQNVLRGLIETIKSQG